MAAPVVGLVGLKALQRDMARLGADTGPLNKSLAAAGKAALAPVANRAREKMPERTGKLRHSVRVNATKSGASMRSGGASWKVAYAGPADFGGYPEGWPYIATGRYMYPAATELATEAAESYSVGIQGALDAFPWTNETSEGEAVHD